MRVMLSQFSPDWISTMCCILLFCQRHHVVAVNRGSVHSHKTSVRLREGTVLAAADL